MQDVVHSVFFTVAGLTVTLLTVGLTGIIVLVVTNADTPQAESRAAAHATPDGARVLEREAA